MKKAIVIVLVTVTMLAVSLFAGGGPFASAQAGNTAVVQTKVTTLHIDGMSCGSCVTAVKRVLSKVAGVVAVNVSYEEKRSVVTYDPAKVTPQKIASAVEEKLPTYKATVIK